MTSTLTVKVTSVMTTKTAILSSTLPITVRLMPTPIRLMPIMTVSVTRVIHSTIPTVTVLPTVWITV